MGVSEWYGTKIWVSYARRGSDIKDPRKKDGV